MSGTDDDELEMKDGELEVMVERTRSSTGRGSPALEVIVGELEGNGVDLEGEDGELEVATG